MRRPSKKIKAMDLDAMKKAAPNPKIQTLRSKPRCHDLKLGHAAPNARVQTLQPGHATPNPKIQILLLRS